MSLPTQTPSIIPHSALRTPHSVVLLVRVLLTLLLVAVIISFAHLAISHKRVDWANAVVGPLEAGAGFPALARESAGQSFVSRYPNLSGIEVLLGTYGRGSNPDKATLLLKVRREPGDGPVLATSVLPPRRGVAENSWYTFTFAPIQDSQDKSFYFEITSPDGTPQNALTLYWWQSDPDLPTDPYVGGTVYLDGRAQSGDLTFGIYYTPTALEAFAQVARAASGNFPPALMVLLLVMAGGLAGLLLFGVPSLLRRPQSRGRLVRLTLPFVLLVALVNGLLYLFLVPPWQGPDEHGHFVYAALLDRHGLDDGAVQRLEWWEGGKDRAEIVALKTVTWDSMRKHDWSHLLLGYPAPGATAFPLGSDIVYTDFIWQTRQAPSYYWLSAAAFQVARAAGIEADPFSNPEGAMMIMRFVSLLLNLGVVALAWLAALLISPRRDSWLRLLLPLALALLPMHTFIAVSGDNDISAELAVTALFVAAVALARWPRGWRGVGFAALTLALTALCFVTKSTAVAAGATLAGLSLALWAGRLLADLIHARLRRGKVERATEALTVPLGLCSAFLLLFALALIVTFEPEERAAGWETAIASQRAPSVELTDAYQGAYAMQLEPGQATYQWIDLPRPHPAYSMTLALWARSPEEGGEPPQATLVVDERGRLPLIGAETFAYTENSIPLTITEASAWTPFTLTVPVEPGHRKVLVQLKAGSHRVQFDNLSLQAGGAQSGADGDGRGYALPLFNPSAETGTRKLRPLLDSIVPAEQALMLDVLVNPQAYDRSAVMQRYAYRQFRSFWGNFGWVSLPLPEALFHFIEALIVVALGGLLYWSARHVGRWGWREWLGLVALSSFGIATVMGFAKQMAPISINGEHTDPAGRYLFVLMTPVVWLLLAGLGVAWSAVGGWWRRPANKSVGTKGEVELRDPMPWGVWLLCLALFLFSAYCLLGLITPYYYG